MENMQYAEELVREFLVFRGFTNTLQTFEKELGTDIGKGFQLDKILGLIFSVYIPQFQAENLIGLLSFFKKCFSFSEATLIATLSKLETSILRYYIIHAIRLGKKEKVLELFGLYGNDLMQRDQDWTSWFAILYIKNPSLDPRFRLYFSKEWSDALHLSARNFLSGMFNGTRIPALLKISSERNTVNRLEKDVKLLNQKLSQLQALLELRDAQLSQSKSSEHGSAHSLSEPLEKNTFLSSFHGTCVPGAQYIEETESQDVDVATSAESYSTSKHDSKEGDSERNKAFQMFQDGLPIDERLGSLNVLTHGYLLREKDFNNELDVNTNFSPSIIEYICH